MNFSSNRWVLLHHQVGDRLVWSRRSADRGDFDFMLAPVGSLQEVTGSENSRSEDSRCLWTWAIPVNPLDQSLPLECSADRLPNHRAAYLEYEGPVSGDRGNVQRVANGSYQVVSWSEKRIELRVTCSNTIVTGHDGPFSVLLTRQGESWNLSWSATPLQTRHASD